MNDIKVYIKINKKGFIEEINSDVFIANVDGYIQIDQGISDKYAHAQNLYLEEAIYDEHGRNNYIYENKKIRALTEDEKNTLNPIVIEPSELELLKQNQERTDQAVQDLILATLGG